MTYYLTLIITKANYFLCDNNRKNIILSFQVQKRKRWKVFVDHFLHSMQKKSFIQMIHAISSKNITKVKCHKINEIFLCRMAIQNM